MRMIMTDERVIGAAQPLLRINAHLRVHLKPVGAGICQDIGALDHLCHMPLAISVLFANEQTAGLRRIGGFRRVLYCLKVFR